MEYNISSAITKPRTSCWLVIHHKIFKTFLTKCFAFNSQIFEPNFVDKICFQIFKKENIMCEIVNCSVIDVSTCSPIYEPGPNTSELYLEEDQELYTLYDEEGCFYTDILRETNSYKKYMTFSLWMGIMTIGKDWLHRLYMINLNF